MPVPVGVPRAHDCITLFLGSRDRYAREAAAHPGTDWYVQDYLARSSDGSAFAGVGAASDAPRAPPMRNTSSGSAGRTPTSSWEVMGAWREHDDRAAFVDLGIGSGGAAEAQAQDVAQARGWSFERLAGEAGLVRRLIHGDWDPADFLVVQPGETIAMSYADGVVVAASA